MMPLPQYFGGGSLPLGYSVVNSARFNGTNAYFTRTASAGNLKTWTLSMWTKRTTLTRVNDFVFGVSVAGADNFGIRFGTGGFANDYLDIYSQFDNEFQWTSQVLFRDPNAWGHLVIAMDVSQGVNASKIKIYWNGAQLTGVTGTVFAGPYPTSTADMKVNAAGSVMYLGKRGSGASVYTSCSISEIVFVDGQQLAPSSFGKFDANSVWVPAKYTGTYGTNGCKLEFKNAGNLGTDTSGNGNHWTANGFTASDQMVDTPTNNYCTWNPLSKTTYGTWTIGGGNLETSCSYGSGYYPHIFSTLQDVTVPFYFEIKNTSGGAGGFYNGSGVSTKAQVPISDSLANIVGYTYDPQGFMWWGDGRIIANGSFPYTTLTGAFATFPSNSVRMFAVDPATGKIWVGQDGTWWNSGNPATGANPTFTSTSRAFTPAHVANDGGGATTANFGATAFAYTPPTGFKTLCTANLTSTAVTTSGTFTGNANVDGPFIWTNGSPATLTINGNAVTFGTHADKTAGGFKLRSSSASYNTSGSNTWTATSGKRFVYSSTSINNAQGNP